MSKFGKVCVSLLLALVAFLGVFLGVTTKGFKDWSKYSFFVKAENSKNEDTLFEINEKDFEAKYLFSFYEVSFVDVSTQVFDFYVYDEETNYDDYTKYYSEYTRAQGIKEEFFVFSGWEGKYCEFLFNDFYEGVKNEKVINSFSFLDNEKSVYKTSISSITTTLNISDNLSEYKELIEAGEDYSYVFKVYKQVIFTLNSQSLYDIEIVYNVYDLES